MKKGKKMVNDELSMMNAKANSQSTNHHSPLIKDGYKKTEIGIIPEDWEVKRLGEIFEITSSKRVFQSEWKSKGVPFYRARELAILGLKGKIDNKLFITKEMYRSFKKVFGVPKIGDMLVTGVGTLGKTYVVTNNEEFYFKDGNIIWFKVAEKLISEFLRQQFLTPFVITQIENTSAGTTVGTYTISDAKKTLIPLPPLPEQKAIAEVLSDTDELIQTLEMQIAKKQLIKQGAMQVLLSPPATTQMLNGELSMVNEKEKWEVKKLTEVSWFQEGPGVRKHQFTTSGVKLLNGTNIEKGHLLLDKTDRYISNKEANGWYSHFLVDPNDLLIACSGVSIDKFHEKVTFATKEHLPLCMNTSTMRFKTQSNSLYRIFLFHFLKSSSFKKQIAGKATGSAQLNFGPSHVSKVKIDLPPIQEQIRIATILSDMDSEIETLENKLAKYKKIKQGMMQELLTGKIRLVNIAQINKENRVKVVPIKQKEKQKLRKDHNWQINEAVVISVLTEKFGSEDYPLGRKRYTKFSYLLHRHSEHKAEGYLKKAAGPYNPSTKYKGPESIAQKNKYIQRKKKGKLSGFVAAENIEKAQEYFKKWYGDEALEWLEQFMFETNDTLELWTTVDMAIQDLREKEKVVTVETVKSLINNHKEWKPKLKRPVFSDENIEIAINKLQSILKEH